jgi:hypothetical protein
VDVTTNPTGDTPWLIDGHVHVHPCFSEDDVFESASSNLARAARGLGAEGNGPRVLLLTESAGDHFFRRALERAAGPASGRWTFRETGEPDSVTVRGEGENPVVVVAGRQVVTSDALEVLALCRDVEVPDGRPIGRTLDDVRGAGALAAVPWGFGKWWLGRGRIVRDLIDREDPATFFLGDNGGRPAMGRKPALFRRAARRGIRVLPGSDPLPFPAQARRVGSYGFVVAGPLDTERPARSLRDALTDPGTRPRPFGRGERLIPFVRSQVAMQLRGRRGGGRG